MYKYTKKSFVTKPVYLIFWCKIQIINPFKHHDYFETLFWFYREINSISNQLSQKSRYVVL